MIEETARTLKGGWLHTGDMAKMDERAIYILLIEKRYG